MVPPQEEGTSVQAEAQVEVATAGEAIRLYEAAVERLFLVSGWRTGTDQLSARFHIMNGQDTPLERPVQIGDTLRVDIPGPGSVAGGGYDWVKVEELQVETGADEAFAGFRVRPADHEEQVPDGQHFFAANATSTFLVVRQHNKVSAVVFDRNLKPNTKGNFLDMIRNFFAGLFAMAGGSKQQWKQLAEGILHGFETR